MKKKRIECSISYWNTESLEHHHSCTCCHTRRCISNCRPCVRLCSCCCKSCIVSDLKRCIRICGCLCCSENYLVWILYHEFCGSRRLYRPSCIYCEYWCCTCCMGRNYLSLSCCCRIYCIFYNTYLEVSELVYCYSCCRSVYCWKCSGCTRKSCCAYC